MVRPSAVRIDIITEKTHSIFYTYEKRKIPQQLLHVNKECECNQIVTKSEHRQ
jgi:hypothetical protein